MGCTAPITAWRSKDGPVQFRAGPSHKIKLPCGRCAGCLLENSRQWATRCLHEAQMHDQNCFATLTIDDNNIGDGTLRPEHFTDFIKRLRAKHAHYDEMGNYWRQPIRYYMCGEYGDETARPHYHACLFGYKPSDGKPTSIYNTTGTQVSLELDKIWKLGGTSYGEVTFESASYVARYIMKKLDQHAIRSMQLDMSTGECIEMYPEYQRMSETIGLPWIKKYATDVYSQSRDEIIIRGNKAKPPRAYDKYLETWKPELHTIVKENRRTKEGIYREDNTPRALKAKEAIMKSKLTRRTAI